VIDEVKDLSNQSLVVQKICGLPTSLTTEREGDSNLRTQLSLLQRVAAFSQAYPELTPSDESFVDWFISRWGL